MKPTALKLGQRLIDEALLSPIELDMALLEQRGNPVLLGDILLSLHLLDEPELIPILGQQLGLQTPDLSTTTPEPDTLNLLPASFIRQEQCLPVKAERHPQRSVLQVALANPQDLIQLDKIQHHLPPGWQIEPCLGGRKALSVAIERLLGIQQRHIEQTLLRIEEAPEHLYQGHAAIELADELLAEAVDLGASDIHFEPDLQLLKIRLRIDGLLRTSHLLRAHVWPALLVRLKLLNGMDISNNRQPQDGRMTFERPARTIDIRASTLPTLHGENLVLRLLDRSKGIRPLAALGLSPSQSQLLEQLLAMPEGLLLVIGPTGSGKTTTLYAMLRHLQREALHIMTLEDPVEYALTGIRQTAIDPPRIDFADGIRAMLRQDPDVLLVGEIRDEETAAMTLRAAQTGHQVFSTLHASSPFTALPRLQQLKLPLAALRGSLNGIVSQRLLRRLCQHCRTAYTPEANVLSTLGLSPDQAPIFYRSGACQACQGTGYQGQLPLIEILPFTPALDDLLDDHVPLKHADATRIARQAGWQTLAEHGRQRVINGETSVEEFFRTVSTNSAFTSPAT